MKRRLLRTIARGNMEREGFTRLNDKHTDKVTGEKYSFFSERWREFIPKRGKQK